MVGRAANLPVSKEISGEVEARKKVVGSSCWFEKGYV